MSPEARSANSPPAALRRELGPFSAVMLGLGSILGTGVFVSIGIAAGIVGPAVMLAIALAAIVATCNALSSAQLAASHPTSGGTYEYGYVYLTPTLGFAAGWMFLCAKSASAATAALGLSGYLLQLLGIDQPQWRIAIGVLAAATVVGLVLTGVRRSSTVNTIIVTITLISLLLFVVVGLVALTQSTDQPFSHFFQGPSGDSRSAVLRMLEATALMFVAFTGYGRIATMGEEVREPERTIPRAIVTTLIVSSLLYIGVSVAGIGSAGAQVFSNSDGTGQSAPLAVAARTFDLPGVWMVVSIGAITAMLGVLLNLILGLSRVALAMGRRGDLPRAFERINRTGHTPFVAVLGVGLVVVGLTAIGSIKLAWSFSAFTVLVYYAITNLACIAMPRVNRLYHPALAWFGLFACLSLAFWVEPRAWIAGLSVLGAGLVLRWLFSRRRTSSLT